MKTLIDSSYLCSNLNIPLNNNVLLSSGSHLFKSSKLKTLPFVYHKNKVVRAKFSSKLVLERKIRIDEINSF